MLEELGRNQVQRPEKGGKQKTPALTRERGTDTGNLLDYKAGSSKPALCVPTSRGREGTHVCPRLISMPRGVADTNTTL